MSKLTAVAVAAALLLIPRTVAAHTDDELDAWTLEWARRAISVGLTVDVAAEYEDWVSRHPRYFRRPVPHAHPRRTYTGSVEQWRGLVATYFRPGDVDRALRIMACESGGNPSAYHSGSGASGLMQHLRRYWTARSAAAGFPNADPFNPTANVATAAWLRDQPGGWLHWRACL